MSSTQDPSAQWATQLRRLDPARRAVVVEALSHSAASGWPASERAVELLVDYALGEITAASYAAGILRSLGFSAPEQPDRPQAGEPAAPSTAPSTAPARAAVGREDAVLAYVTGAIDVGEFLRIARA